MSDIGNAFGLISGLERSMFDRRVLTQAFERTAERARNDGLAQLTHLQRLCGQFAAGMESDFSAVSRDGHIAAFDVITYGDVCVSLGIRPAADCEHLIQCGQALQERLLSHEALYLQNALSPCDVFYDDLFPLAAMRSAHLAVAMDRWFSSEAVDVDGSLDHATLVAVTAA